MYEVTDLNTAVVCRNQKGVDVFESCNSAVVLENQ
jgi:hypothetical protein